MATELEKALDRNEEVFEPTWDESLLFREAARRVVNLDIDAAWERWLDGPTRHQTGHNHVRSVVNTALGITTKDENLEET